MKAVLALICIFWMLVLPPSAFVKAENSGLANFDIDGGNRGNIPFPHSHHQLYPIDCDTCHAVFPKRAGAIRRLVEEGGLAKKQVMNSLCISCHKNNKQIGNNTGPTTCKACHLKK